MLTTVALALLALAAVVVLVGLLGGAGAEAAIAAPRYVWYCFVALDPFDHAFWQCGWYPA